MDVRIKFSTKLQASDPKDVPVLIIGQLKNLNKVNYDTIKIKLEPRVSEEVYHYALSNLHPTPTDLVNLYLNFATLAALPVKCSRHNAPSRPHALTRIVRSVATGGDEYIVIVCEKNDVFPSGCALARAFPLYSRKTHRSALQGRPTSVTVTVEFLILEDNHQTRTLTEDEASALHAAATGIRLAARIVDTPCNEMNVTNLLNEINNIANELGVRQTVIQGEELKHKGLNGIYHVGKAANCPPALAVLSHTPPGATKTIAWVGKGVVYDSGGLSLKTKTEMPGMKRECGGAAGILGAFYAVVKQGFTQNLHAVFCLAENAVGPEATRSDDIQIFYSGKSVEINNTDAEGRLVLADGVVYASKDLNASIILDLATLTYAQALTTGKYHGGLLTNSSEWEDSTCRAGRISGDLVFPMVYCPELHFSEFTSIVADMKNSVADCNNAQSSCAGLFVLSHLGFDFPGAWIHIDMLAVVNSGERATGYGVALLTALFGEYSTDKMFKYIGQSVMTDCVSGEDGYSLCSNQLNYIPN